MTEDSTNTSPTIRLRLHVPTKEPTDTTPQHAIQGQLFDTGESTHTTGYRGSTASKIAGITYRQLDYWARKHIIEPSIQPSHGSGTRRLYAFKDIVILAVSKKLLDAGINLHNITTAINCLMQHTTNELEHITILCDGQTVYECTTDEQVIQLVRSGQAIFGVSVGSLWHHTKNALQHEEPIALADTKPTLDHNKPLDDITARRLHRQQELLRSAEHSRTIRLNETMREDLEA
ncbi:MerR family transcriptional regulator [Bifidobacterium vansinderenii]|uniref:Transcriptional regulator n=1 Tax=Bifidobacterium vansinderenii TaxID=1984871 RepID=A0A229VUF1_9BIFI|nr:MerR family transcriptional regulator [Bifidobacterium vansinderenii]OXM99274.1 transcriptional regulator [Bifidobacterium vansinderenii]